MNFKTFIENAYICDPKDLKRYQGYQQFANDGQNNCGMFINADGTKIMKIGVRVDILNLIDDNISHLFPKVFDRFDMIFMENSHVTTVVVMEFINGGDMTKFLFSTFPKAKIDNPMFDDISFLFRMKPLRECDALFSIIYDAYKKNLLGNESIEKVCKDILNNSTFESESKETAYVTTTYNGVDYLSYVDIRDMNTGNISIREATTQQIISDVMLNRSFFCNLFSFLDKQYTEEQIRSFHESYVECVLKISDKIEEKVRDILKKLYAHGFKFQDFKTDNFGVRIGDDVDDFDIVFLDWDSGLYKIPKIDYEHGSFENEYASFGGVFCMDKLGQIRSNYIYQLNDTIMASQFMLNMFQNDESFNTLSEIVCNSNEFKHISLF